MRNDYDYRYIDPDYTYTDPQTGILRNLAGITDREALIFAEAAATTKRAGELKAKPIRIKDSGALFAIHRHLFQDIYDWAGKQRTVEISKGGKQFFPLSHFANARRYIDSLISEYRPIDENDREKPARKLAEILDAVNFLHPFREGNGRTQREFLRLLAQEKNRMLNLNPPDDAEVYERYMAGTINADVDALAKLIYECLNR
ncbi:MAG: Fic family protein [Clostridiales Family XIII bacterium]|jgi:cell filamentation protein|nr:Fic family protein [Clostridiales Family XIII bacterium]